MKCWVIGDSCVDLFPKNENTYLKCVGGTATNIAVCLAKLEVNSNLIAKMGDDPLGKFVLNHLKIEGVGTKHVSFSKSHKTTLIIVDLNDFGDRSFTYVVDIGADTQLIDEDIPEFGTGDWLCVSSVVLSRNPSRKTCFSAIKKIKSMNGIVCVDANMRENMWDDPELMIPVTLKSLQMADIIKASEEEILKLTDTDSLNKAIDVVKTWPCRLAVITLAERGSVAIFNGKVLDVVGYEVPVVDMTGAGDAFMAAMVSNLMNITLFNEESVGELLKYANACGALAVGKKGAVSSLPTKTELSKFLSKHNI